MVGMGGARPPRAGRHGNGRRLPVAPRFAPGDRRRAGRTRPCRAGGGGARPTRHPAHPRPERGGRPLRPWLRPRAGPPVADGDESPNRCGASRRGAGRTRPRHRPAAAGARSLSPGGGHHGAPLARRAEPDRPLRQRGQRVAGVEDGSPAPRVPDHRVRARALDGDRHGSVGQGDGPRPRARVVARPHAASHVGVSRPGADPRLLHALPRGHASRSGASGGALGRGGERPGNAARTLRTGVGSGRRLASRRSNESPGRPHGRRPDTRPGPGFGSRPPARSRCGYRPPGRFGGPHARALLEGVRV